MKQTTKFFTGCPYEMCRFGCEECPNYKKCFAEIPSTKIFITPGNHDPYIKDSIYDTTYFGSNVYIFKVPI